MEIAILGFGLEGKSVLKFLRKTPQFKNADISILDRKLNKNYLKNLEKFDIIFRSPGVPYNLLEVQNAIKNGVEVTSGTELFFQIINTITRDSSKKIKIIGVTGTKGKSTTSTLLYKILKSAGKNTYLAGNVGKPALEILPKLKKKSIVVLELSNFQLQGLNPPVGGPDIAVVLNVFPDHLDIHKNFKEYIEAKANIAKCQKKTNKVFYFSDNKYSQLVASKSRAKKFPIQYNDVRHHYIEKLVKLPSNHNLKNTLMAAEVAKNLDIPNKIILKVIKNFRGLEHRLELVRTIRNNQFQEVRPPKINKRQYLGCRTSQILKSASINFYNDSASTNPKTAAAAISAFSKNQPLILIAGGKDKNLNYSPLAKALKNSNTKLVILFGENKNKIRKVISGQEPSTRTSLVRDKLVIREVKNLNQAVKFAYKTAKSIVASGYSLNPVIIFSPSSASFDMFKDYRERGEKFKEIVKSLRV